MPRRLQVLVFIAILSLFLYIANLVVYEALAGIFFINVGIHNIVLGAVLGIFSGSFIVANLVGMRYYNIATRIYYTLAAAWIGLFVYLFLASFVYGLVILVSGIDARSVGGALMAIAVVVSAYGLWHGRQLQIRSIEVALPNVPPQWKGKKALWMSDLHLGQLYGPSYAQKVADKVKGVAPDIIFIGGDLYDGTSAPDPSVLIAPLKTLSTPLGVYFITGNHEEFGDASAFLAAVRSLGIRVLQDEMIEVAGMQLMGVDYHTASNAGEFKNILAKLQIDPNKPSMLLKHEPKDLAVAEAAGISLQISGHTHRAQMWPLGYVAQLTYKGYAYGLRAFGRMQVYTSSGTGTWGPPLRVGTDSELVVIRF